MNIVIIDWERFARIPWDEELVEDLMPLVKRHYLGGRWEIVE